MQDQDHSYYVISENDEMEDSLMLKINMFSTEEDYRRSLSSNSISSIKEEKEGSISELNIKSSSMSTNYSHRLKSKLRSRISNALRSTSKKSWVSSRSILKNAFSQHDQICEFINVVTNQSRCIHKKSKSAKIKDLKIACKNDDTEQWSDATVECVSNAEIVKKSMHFIPQNLTNF